MAVADVVLILESKVPPPEWRFMQLDAKQQQLLLLVANKKAGLGAFVLLSRTECVRSNGFVGYVLGESFTPQDLLEGKRVATVQVRLPCTLGSQAYPHKQPPPLPAVCSPPHTPLP